MIANVDINPFGYINFSCRKGDAFTKSIEALNDDETPFDFTDYTAKMEVRSEEGGEIIETFSTADDTIILSEGQILLDKDSITGDSGEYKHHFQLTKNGRNQTIAIGNFIILDDLTE